MKKKIGLSLLVLAAAVLLTAGYFAFLAPKAHPGTKSVTVQVVIPQDKIQKTFHYTTTRPHLADLIQDERSDLKAETKAGQYGLFLTGMLGVHADPKKEYFNVKVDGKDATVGISQIPIEDGKTYTFTLTAL